MKKKDLNLRKSRSPSPFAVISLILDLPTQSRRQRTHSIPALQCYTIYPRIYKYGVHDVKEFGPSFFVVVGLVPQMEQNLSRRCGYR